MATYPFIVIVGRPNVGKSTLFNRLTQSKHAIVSDQAGTTRDRIHGYAKINDQDVVVIDTGGMEMQKDDLQSHLNTQVKIALEQADIIIWLVDGRTDLTSSDIDMAQHLRHYTQPTLVVLNKIDGANMEHKQLADMHSVGYHDIHHLSAKSGYGIDAFIQAIHHKLPQDVSEDTAHHHAVRFSLIGRPNVGKSTLTNCLLGEERVIVSEKAGTTRDSIEHHIEHHGKHYLLTDTAGLRKRNKLSDNIDYYSYLRTLKSLKGSNVAVFLVDAHEGITEGDRRLLNMIITSGKALVIAINKWDHLDREQKQLLKITIEDQLAFVSFAKVHLISAKYGRGVSSLWKSIDNAYSAAMQTLPTAKLTAILNQAVSDHPPPLYAGKLIKLRYAHLIGSNPPQIMIHGKRTNRLAMSYKRYLIHYFRKCFGLHGTPIMLEFQNDHNPYQKT